MVALRDGVAHDTSGSSLTLGPLSVNAGELLVVTAMTATSNTATGVSDTGGNTWTAVDSLFNGSQIYWAIAKATASISVTVTGTGGLGYVGAAWGIYPPDAGTSWAASPVDSTFHGHNSGSGTAPQASAAFSPTATDLVVGGHKDGGNGVTTTPNASYLNGTSGSDHRLAYNSGGNQDNSQIWWQDSAGSSTTPGLTLGSSQSWTFLWASFKLTASASPTTYPAWRRPRRLTIPVRG